MLALAIATSPEHRTSYLRKEESQVVMTDRTKIDRTWSTNLSSV